MQAFDYQRATSVEEAVALLVGDSDGVRPLSGGTDLIVQLREGRRNARLVVDLKSIDELSELRYDPQHGLRIGAAVQCYRIYGDPTIAAAYPGLIDAVSLIGGIQIQGRASVGGNLCNASPAADSIPALIVHNAVCEIAGPNGRRSLPVEEMCTGPGRTALGQGELLVAIHVPPPLPNSGAAYLRFIPRNEMDIAVVGAGAAITLDERGEVFVDARLALGAVGPTPILVSQAAGALIGLPVSPESLGAAADLARAAARPITDMRGTTTQRTHLSGVLARRAIELAVARARGVS